MIPGLIKYQLLSLPEFDVHLAKMIEARHKPAFDFAMFLFKVCLLERRDLPPSDLRATLEVITKIARANKDQE